MKIPNETWLEAYLSYKQKVWSINTLKSETCRLKKIAHILNSDPTFLLELTKTQGKYTQLTTWARVIDFYDYLVKHKAVAENNYRDFREENKHLFSKTKAYKKNFPTVSYDEAYKKINKIKNPKVRLKALQLLESGMRFTESFSFKRLTKNSGRITGKGGKVRDVFCTIDCDFKISHCFFYKQLKKHIGLKPHDLRKIFATKMAKEFKSDLYEFKEIMGWASIETAASYIKINTSDLMERIGGIHGNGKELRKAV